MRSAGARLGLGTLTGLIGLVAMVRLVAGAFSGGVSAFAWVVTLLAMVPWVVYVAWRAHRSRPTRRGAGAVLVLDLIGMSLVGVLVVGPVVALGVSFAAFAVLWSADRPVRPRRGIEQFVPMAELGRPAEANETEPTPQD